MRAEFGYVLARLAWGQGIASEAAAMVRDYAFASVGIHRLFATCQPGNQASIRVLEKTGLQYEGRLRDHKMARGVWRDSLMYAAIAPSRRVGLRHRSGVIENDESCGPSVMTPAATIKAIDSRGGVGN